MIDAPSADRNVFKQIFADHWDDFKRWAPHYDTRYYDGLVDKMLDRPCKDARAVWQP